MRKIIGIFICLLFVISIVDVSFAGSSIGGTKYGWVEKSVYGNPNAAETVVLITGVHPREYGFHDAIAAAVSDKSSSLSKRYIVYRVHVTKSPWSYSRGRMYGQLLANKFVVRDVKAIRPKIAVDIHENMGKKSGYKYAKFLDPISKTWLTRSYANVIISKMPFLAMYSPKGTSPKYVTNPLAKSGIPTLVYETYKFDSYGTKYSDASQFVTALDQL